MTKNKRFKMVAFKIGCSRNKHYKKADMEMPYPVTDTKTKKLS